MTKDKELEDAGLAFCAAFDSLILGMDELTETSEHFVKLCLKKGMREDAMRDFENMKEAFLKFKNVQARIDALRSELLACKRM